MVLDCMDSLSLLSSFLCKTFYQISVCEVLNFLVTAAQVQYRQIYHFQF